MANTIGLKTVESELSRKFCSAHKCKPLDFPKKVAMDIFSGMQPDLVAYDESSDVPYICEMTTSGFRGHRGNNFHIGGVRKLTDTFSRFYIIHADKDEIIRKIQRLYPAYACKVVLCYLVVPKGWRPLNSLGYRKKLFNGIMKLEQIPLSDETANEMIAALEDSSKETTPIKA